MKNYRVYLAQILECIRKIETYTKEGKEGFLNSELNQDAVIRNFQIIGEASKRLPEKFRNKYPDIPWQSIVAFRNVLIHNYDTVSLEEVWNILENELHPIKTAIESALPPLDELEKEIAEEND